MVRTIKEATVKSFHYASIQELRRHVGDWLITYNFAKQLKALRWRTQVICEAWTKDPLIFKIDPHQLIPGPHT